MTPNNNAEILNILNCFYHATEIGAICVDPEMHIVAASPSDSFNHDFFFFGMNQIIPILKEKFSQKEIGGQCFYTCFLESNLVCNISFMTEEDSRILALISQPVLIKDMPENEIEQILNQPVLSDEEKESLRISLSKIPVINYDRVMSLGKVLHNLSNPAKNTAEAQQVLWALEDHRNLNQTERLVFDDSKVTATKRNRLIDYEIYTKVREYIENGDPGGLKVYLNSINSDEVQWEHLVSNDFIRSLKDGFITSCALSCFSAMEAGVRYEKVMDLTDEAIGKVEELENIYDIYELLKSTVAAFAREVSVSRSITYSKPTRQVLDYIDINYSRRITLDDLSKHTNFSVFYISNIVKKETGLSITENIVKVRIEKSKRLLLGTNDSILDVAQQVGYQYQNHFALIFKRSTGFSPTEYRNLIKGKKDTVKKQHAADDLPIILQQVQNRLLHFNDWYDHARIVDIKSYTSWLIDNKDLSMREPLNCFEHWGKNEACKDCVSSAACIRNSTVLKIIEQDHEVFLVVGIPYVIAKNKYAVEIIKRITDNVIFEINGDGDPEK